MSAGQVDACIGAVDFEWLQGDYEQPYGQTNTYVTTPRRTYPNTHIHGRNGSPKLLCVV